MADVRAARRSTPWLGRSTLTAMRRRAAARWTARSVHGEAARRRTSQARPLLRLPLPRQLLRLGDLIGRHFGGNLTGLARPNSRVTKGSAEDFPEILR